MNDDLERYRCQMALPGFGEQLQERLQNARVLIVGMGGLGCPAAQYLAAAGIGTLGLADDDRVSVSNLHRQILFTPEEAGLPKVNIASGKLQRQNPLIRVIPYHLRVTSSNVMDLIAEFDLVIDGTDNFETKYLLNDACVMQGKPLVYGAIYQFDGQVSVWNVLQKDGAYSCNYRDVFPDAETAQVPNCAESGVIPTLAGIVGCMQANEAIKYFTGAQDLLSGKLWMINVQDGSARNIDLKKQTGVAITELAETVATITLDELQRDSDKRDYELIDVRAEDEHNAFNIGGKNIPLGILKDQLDRLSLSHPIVCYCASGNRSAEAARLIKRRFPEAKIFSLKGGIPSPLWQVSRELG